MQRIVLNASEILGFVDGVKDGGRPDDFAVSRESGSGATASGETRVTEHSDPLSETAFCSYSKDQWTV